MEDEAYGIHIMDGWWGIEMEDQVYRRRMGPGGKEDQNAIFFVFEDWNTIFRFCFYSYFCYRLFLFIRLSSHCLHTFNRAFFSFHFHDI